MNKYISFPLIALALLLFGLSTPGRADLTVISNTGTISETGTTNDSGKAILSVNGGTLTIVLQNTTTSPATTQAGDTLTGFGFSISGTAPSLSLTTIALTSGSSIWTAYNMSNTSNPLSGSWTSSVASGNPTGIGFGVATSGEQGNFQGNTISRGGDNPDYGIVSAGTFPTVHAHDFGGSQYPFIQDSLTFTFSGASGLDLSTLGDFRFFFGTDGGNLTGTEQVQSVPEPSTFALAGLSILGFLGYTWRRYRAAQE